MITSGMMTYFARTRGAQRSPKGVWTMPPFGCHLDSKILRLPLRLSTARSLASRKANDFKTPQPPRQTAKLRRSRECRPGESDTRPVGGWCAPQMQDENPAFHAGFGSPGAAQRGFGRLGVVEGTGLTSNLLCLRYWERLPSTNAIERLHEELKQRIKTQTVLPSAETAAMLFWALMASGQIIDAIDRRLADASHKAARSAD